MDYVSHSEAETEDLGRRLGAALEYEGTGLPLFHFDMYRLEGPEDLFGIGWEDYLDRGGVCAVEWSERVEEALPEDAVTVTIARCSEDENWRVITLEGVEPV